jgi:NADH-quinone oxidoreductase subunit C
VATTPGSLRSSERVEPEAFRERVATKLGDSASDVEVRFGQVWLATTPEDVVEAVRTLKEDPELYCSYLTFLSGVDWKEEGFEVVIVLYSLTHLNTVGLKVRLTRENPSMPTLTSLYGGADWHERECHEMFGIDFEGHRGLTPLYLPEDFEGHPLRKDFKLASRTYKPWPGAKEPGEAGGRT